MTDSVFLLRSCLPFSFKALYLKENQFPLKTHLFAFTVIFFALLTSSCQKKPSASFSTDKEVYMKFDAVRLSNTSDNAYYYTWIVNGPGGEEIRSSKENFSFDLSQVGNYEITLCVYSKNGRELSKVSKTIESQKIVTPYVFYTNSLNSTLKNVSIYIDNQFMGMLTTNCYNTPTCGTLNTLTVEIPDGVHDLRFTFGPIGHNKVYYDVNFSHNGRACSPYLISS